MTVVLEKHEEIETVADLLDRLGGISPNRIRYRPAPGTATEADVAAIEAKENRLYELIDGVLVEKSTGYRESLVAGWILTALNVFVMPRKLGFVTGADGIIRLFPGLVRIPDVAYVSRERLPDGKVPNEPVPQVVPDLAVEVLSAGNTAAEMDRKRGEYFEAGVRLLWIVDPQTRTADVYVPSSKEPTTLDESSSLDGGDVLPGFALELRTLFAGLTA
jgi:Uma2 family endonuclease